MSSQENVYFSNDIIQTGDNSYVVDGDLCEEVSENLLPTNIYRNNSMTSNDISMQDDSSDDDKISDNDDNKNLDNDDDNILETETKFNMNDKSTQINSSENNKNNYRKLNENDELVDKNISQDNIYINHYDSNNDDSNNDDSNNNDSNDNNSNNNNSNNNDSNNNDSNNNDSNNNDSNNNDSNVSVPEKKRRGPPKSILANQQKYLEILEKQNRMSSKNKKINNQKIQKEEIPKVKNNIDGPKRRVIIGGKVKYLPVNKNEQIEQDKQPLIIKEDEKLLSETEISNILPNRKNNNTDDINDNTYDNNNTDENDIKMEVIKKRRPVGMNKFTKTNEIKNNNVQIENKQEKLENNQEIERKIPSSIAKKMEMHAAKQTKETNLPGRKNKTGGKKIPSKYAKQMENDVKKQTVRNVKSFSDLRRIKTLQDISSGDIQDTNKASMTELRKLRMEQKKENKLN
ncbi:hypothetical protein QJ854_gp648 [Moumouvirus goulette]|uniref:Uncharacterized protein n=1 Tax=Moumouvirus goulette TaxID=1247379 RepID=M1PB62_9VIRU|nr:hypothetical protein QJ854_gp648 [Moumouvirus goulette]AGF85134.1 hypothetical protein glt_00325 [Moumouvirus goulette]